MTKYRKGDLIRVVVRVTKAEPSRNCWIEWPDGLGAMNLASERFILGLQERAPRDLEVGDRVLCRVMSGMEGTIIAISDSEAWVHWPSCRYTHPLSQLSLAD